MSKDVILRARSNDSLTLDEMRATLPAIFAPEAHKSRSDRYVYVDTSSVLTALMGQGFTPVEARVSRTRDEGRQGFTKHMVRLRHHSDDKTLRVGDTHLEVILRNAHDGSAAYELAAGLFRLVCMNGMTVADSTIGAVRVRHAGDRQKQLDQVIEGAFTIIEHAPAALEAPRIWPTIDLNRDEQMAFAEAARSVRFGDAEGHVDTPITANQLLHPRRSEDQGNNLWQTFNRVQENAVKGGLRGIRRDVGTARWRRTSTREVASIDGDLKLNRALWTLASEMARIKQAA